VFTILGVDAERREIRGPGHCGSPVALAACHAAYDAVWPQGFVIRAAKDGPGGVP
jgi:hypothetical protein